MLYIVVCTVYRRIRGQKKVRNMLYDASHLQTTHLAIFDRGRIILGMIFFILELICFPRLWTGVAG